MTEELEASLRASRIPLRMHTGIIRYVTQGIVPGGFLIAVITNDLKDACRRADDQNQSLLYEYVKWFYNHAPAPCWGSLENFTVWVEDHYNRRAREKKEPSQ